MRLRFLSFLTAGSVVLVAACQTSPDIDDRDGNNPTTDNSSSGGTIEQGSTGGALPSSGGAPAAGGGNAAGGSETQPSGGSGGTVPIDTEPPFFATNVGETEARAAYDAWKAVHLEDCSGGVWRVPWENAKLDSTVSEGVGYGMLLTVIYDDRTAFDGLLAYAKLMRQENQLMNWLRYGCDAHWDTKYNAHPDQAASDADLDVAMALLMAECKWNDAKYGDEATTVINAIKQHMFMEFEGLSVLQPGDSGWFDQMNNGCVNYSYMAPAYYRVFAEHVSGDAEFWNKAAGDTYALLGKASNSSTGLVRNWGSSDGNQATGDCANAYNRAGSYGDDAARTPWRIAMDYLWYGTPEAKAWNDKVTQWVKSQGIGELVQWYNLDGSPDTEEASWSDHTAINIGPFAVGAQTFDQATTNEFTAELVAIPATDGSHDAEYFPRMLKALSLVTLTGKFTQCGGQ